MIPAAHVSVMMAAVFTSSFAPAFADTAPVAPATPAAIVAPAPPVAPVAPAPAASTASSAATADISGTIVNQLNGLPVGDASVALYRGDAVVDTSKTDANGNYVFHAEPAGAYSVLIRATGYQSTRVSDVFVVGGSTTTVRTPLLLATTSLREIGYVSVSTGAGASLASTSTIQHDLNPEQLAAQGFANAAQALGTIPGIDLSGGQHTAGDDTSIDIRGMGTGEVRQLLDGHPVGPIGVGSPDTYDYANSPYFLLQNIQTTVGSGAAGLYGVDVIGGTIDFQTLQPTRTKQADFYQGVGNQGLGISEVKATGSIGSFGWALGHAVQGSYNDFEPGPVFQSARPNNNANLANNGACVPGSGANPNNPTYPDVSTCNQLANTYNVSGNYRVQNDIGKLQYRFTNDSILTLTAYAANQLSDSTGNGDNDNLPYQTRLAQIENSAPQCTTSGSGASNGYFAYTGGATPASETLSCLSPQQLAADSSGPDGGGEDRNRGTTLQDFHARFNTTIAKKNAFTADVFSDFYDFRKNSNLASGLNAPNGTFFIGGGTFEDEYLTHGLLLSDEIAGQKNDFGFGYFLENQRFYGNTLSVDPVAGGSYNSLPDVGEGDYSFFIRDQFEAGNRLTTYVNAWDRRSNVTERTTFDPRISLVFRPTNRDIARLTAGRADGDPAAIVKSSVYSNLNNPSSLNPSCNLPNSIETGGNPNIQPENARDIEAAYGHRFWADTSVNLVGYVSSEQNRIFSNVLPITDFGPGALAGFTQSQLGLFEGKIQTNCPGQTITLANLGVTTDDNAAASLYRGLELNGRIRFMPAFYMDYTYDIESAQSSGIPALDLQSSPTLIDNAQLYGIPVHKASLTFDYHTRQGIEGQLEGYFIGPNNDLNRPAYSFFNGFVASSIGHGLTCTLGVNNIFSQNVQNYGYFGQQLAVPLNQDAVPAAGALASFPENVQQAVLFGGSDFEEMGLPPRQFTFALSGKV
jgi:outer membrane receptor for ferrienterochelin and colicin